jgi:hypothetical protein
MLLENHDTAVLQNKMLLLQTRLLGLPTLLLLLLCLLLSLCCCCSCCCY